MISRKLIVSSSSRITPTNSARTQQHAQKQKRRPSSSMKRAMCCSHVIGRPNTLLRERRMEHPSPISPIRDPMEMGRTRRAITPLLGGPSRVLISYGPPGMPRATPTPIARMAKKVHLVETRLVGIAPITPSARRILSLARSPSTSPPSGKRVRPSRCSKKRKDRCEAILRSLR